MKATRLRQTLLVGIGIAAVTAAAFGGWWLQDVRVEARWDPDWPRAVRITGEAVEKIVASAGGAATAGDRARAVERARWKAYYYAQLRAAEQLGSLAISAHTSIRDLTEMDQELRTSFAGALRAAAEVDSATELLDDAIRARVTVEIPAEPMRDLKSVIAAALGAGRISVERWPRPRQPASTPAPERVLEAPPAPETDPSASAAPRPAAAETVPEPILEEPPEDPPKVAARPPRPAPAHTGAAVHLAGKPYRLGVTSVLYELGGTEIGSVLDLPPERLAAGFFPIADPGDAAAIRRLAGASPRQLEATISGRDLFLTERLGAPEVRQLQRWLRAGKMVLVLG